MALPIAMVRMVTPSILALNTSPRSQGESIPVNMMVKQEVLLMRIMLPNLMATTGNSQYSKTTYKHSMFG